MNHVHAVTLAIVIASFLIVAYIGFASARWRPARTSCPERMGSGRPGLRHVRQACATLALGSALALFVYPHATTGSSRPGGAT